MITDERQGHLVSVCDYVDLPLGAVIEFLGSADVDALLTDALADALGSDPQHVEVRVEVPEVLGNAMARARVTVSAPGAPSAGTVTAMVVSSGRESLTELLVSVRVGEGQQRRAALAARRFLERVTAILRTRAPRTRV
jgi:hypothetical protein